MVQVTTNLLRVLIVSDARFVDGELYTAEFFSGGADLNVEFDG